MSSSVTRGVTYERPFITSRMAVMSSDAAERFSTKPDAPARNPIFGTDLPRLDEPLPKFLDDDQAARFMAAATRLDPFRRLVVHRPWVLQAQLRILLQSLRRQAQADAERMGRAFFDRLFRPRVAGA